MCKFLFYGLDCLYFELQIGKTQNDSRVYVCVCVRTFTPIVPKESDLKSMTHTQKWPILGYVS